MHNLPENILKTYLPQEPDFGELSPKQQRVMLAKDVIAQLNQKKLIAESGVFIENDSNNGDVCSVCAIGALTISYLTLCPKVISRNVLFDTLDLQNVNEDHNASRLTIQSILAPYFDIEQLELIEAVFEETEAFAKNADVDEAANYGRYMKITQKVRTRTDHDMLILIMQNIIDNDGTFVVPKF